MPILPPVSSRTAQFARTLFPVAWHILSGQPSTLTSVADHLFDGLTLPVQVLGTEHIPKETPFLTIVNHFEQQWFPAWWGIMLLAQSIPRVRTGEPREVRWVMAREWWYPGGIGRYLKQPATHLLFSRLSQVYGTVLLPPILDGDLMRGQGVGGVRHALALTRGPHPQLVGIAPEGHSGPEGRLKEPPPGAGLFLLLLTHDTIPCLPVGWHAEQENGITIRFGEPFQLSVPRIKDRATRDRLAATQAMVAIGKLLPSDLWGVYRVQIGQTVG